jgi:hypothetical protein
MTSLPGPPHLVTLALKALSPGRVGLAEPERHRSDENCLSRALEKRAMPIRKKSLRSRSKRTRRKLSRFITPDLALFQGKLLHFAAGPDDPLSEAERVCGEFAEMVEDYRAAVMQFLQRAYFVADQFRRRRGDFERFQVHSFWKLTRQKPKDPSTSKWVLLFLMQATTANQRHLASKYAVILDGLKQDQVEISAVAARIQELGGVGAAYEAMRARTTGHESRPAPRTTPTAKPNDGDGELFFDAEGPRPGYYIIGRFGEKIRFNPPKPSRPPRKLNHLDLWSTRISQCKAQLPQARTKEERDYLNKKIRVLEHLLQEGRSKALARRLGARAKRRLGW